MKTKILTTSYIALAVLLLACCVAFAMPSSDTESFAYDTTVAEWQEGEFSTLQYGIYWYTEGNKIPVKADKATNFDPSKPTVVFAHGMKAMGEGVTYREGLSLKSATENVMQDDYLYDPEFYNILIQQGYNVGMFYWNQLADIIFTQDMRIWCVQNPEDGLTYTYLDENGKRQTSKAGDPSNPTISVAGLYRDCLLDALGDNFTGHLQLIGHSMGGQLTLAVSQALCYEYDNGRITENYLPDRVSLLDPFIGSDPKIGVVDTTGEEIDDKSNALLAAEASQTIADHNIPIEAFGANKQMVCRYFKTMTELGSYTNLTEEQIQYAIDLFSKNIVWVYIEGIYSYYGAFPTGSSHVTAEDYYFTTIYEEVKKDKYGLSVPSFWVSDEEILSMRGMAFLQSYQAGQNPLYQSQSQYVLVDRDTQEAINVTMSARIFGKVEGAKGLIVKIYSAEEELAITAMTGNYYYFDWMSIGEYVIKFYNGETEVGTAITVNVEKDTSVVTAETQNIVIETEPEAEKSFLQKITDFFKDLIEKITAFFQGLFNKDEE